MTAIVPSGDNEPAAPLSDGERPVWKRCGCDQFGRCLTDCATAHLPWREQPIYRRIFGDRSKP